MTLGEVYSGVGGEEREEEDGEGVRAPFGGSLLESRARLWPTPSRGDELPVIGGVQPASEVLQRLRFIHALILYALVHLEHFKMPGPEVGSKNGGVNSSG